jgi:hypothetical protein
MTDRNRQSEPTVQIHLQGLLLEVGNIAALLKEHLDVVEESPDEPGEPNLVRRRLVIQEPPVEES